jgi:predicted transposase/invertase (TIGR01784 family)
MSRQELQAMFTVSDLKKTRFYQEVKNEGKLEGKLEGRLEGKLEGKLETIPKLFQKGLTIGEIAEILELDVSLVQKIAEQK